MKIKKAAAVPLITHDPYFSIWSASDELNDSTPMHWSGARQNMSGFLIIDGAPFCFLGKNESFPKLQQTKVEITPTSTMYQFEHKKMNLTVTFTSPLLPDDPVLLSRPCSYIRIDGTLNSPANARVLFTLSSDIICETPGEISGGTCHTDTFKYAYMGKAFQHPLGSSGDMTRIDWGFLYLASRSGKVRYSCENSTLTADITLFDKGSTHSQASNTLIAAYDDLLSIYYFGMWKKAYWTTRYSSILEAIDESFADYENVAEKCSAFDKKLETSAYNAGGNAHKFLCAISYRQIMAAHKLIEDENHNLIFLSKENSSNGCIGTADITYPSAPLFLLYNPELLKGMLRPIFRFAKCPVWEFDYAPHDVGRYPYASGQVYGLAASPCARTVSSQHAIYPFFHQFPAGCSIYDHNNQMPTEECGNMLILTAAICLAEQTSNFALPYMDLLKKWKDYLIKYGSDPDKQLCTDDFAGHLAHNTNLSLKAILGIEAYAQIKRLAGEKTGYEKYHKIAASMAQQWEKQAISGTQYKLAFNLPGSWSLKYNLIWDKLFNAKLFSREVYERELHTYISNLDIYGVPLDSRASYTKSDWILWCAAFTDDKSIRETLIRPVASFIENTPCRLPFSDWYDTKTGKCSGFFARSVQGGLFMPQLADQKILHA